MQTWVKNIATDPFNSLLENNEDYFQNVHKNWRKYSIFPYNEEENAQKFWHFSLFRTDAWGCEE